MVTRVRILLAASVTMAALLGGTAQAGWHSSGFSGFVSSTPAGGTPNGVADGHVSFAVYYTPGGGGLGKDWTDDFGAAFAAATTFVGGDTSDASVIYFFQMVNTNSIGSAATDSALDTFFLGIEKQINVTGFGYVTDFVFNDVGAGAVTGANPVLGAGAPADDPAANGAPTFVSPGFIGDAGTPFVADASALEPTVAIIRNSATDVGEAIEFDWANRSIDTGEYTSIFFVTGRGRPEIRTSQVTDGSNTYNEVLTPTPVPPSMVLLLSGVMTCGLGGVIRRRFVA